MLQHLISQTGLYDKAGNAYHLDHVDFEAPGSAYYLAAVIQRLFFATI